MRSLLLAALGLLFAALVADPAFAQFTPVGSGPIHSGGGPGTFTFLNHTATVTGGADSGVTPNIDATGGKLIVINVAQYVGSGVTPCSNIVDSSSNTYTPLTNQNYYTGNVFQTQLWYKISPTVTSSMHFDCPGSGGNSPTLAVVIYGDTGTPTIDGEVGSTNGGFSVQPGNITPATNNEVFVTASQWANLNTGVTSIDSGFTISNQNENGEPPPGIQQFAMAYLIQTTATAENPTWSNTVGTIGMGAVMAAFKP